MKRVWMRWQNFKNKAVTFSYDDGTLTDKRLAEIFDRFGLKCTFNVNSRHFTNATDSNYLTLEEAKTVYRNHEIAVHGVRHVSLTEVDKGMATYDVIADRADLERVFSRVVKGMAYANGEYSDDIVQILRDCGISYARTTVATESFDVPDDWLRMPATCHHNHPRLMEFAKTFVESPEPEYCWGKKPRLFYVWGHSSEFENAKNWDLIESLAAYLGNRDDVWYATNGEIYAYVQAFDRLEFSAEGTRVHNPSAIDVYIYNVFKNKQYVVPAGQTVEMC